MCCVFGGEVVEVDRAETVGQVGIADQCVGSVGDVPRVVHRGGPGGWWAPLVATFVTAVVATVVSTALQVGDKPSWLDLAATLGLLVTTLVLLVRAGYRRCGLNAMTRGAWSASDAPSSRLDLNWSRLVSDRDLSEGHGRRGIQIVR